MQTCTWTTRGGYSTWQSSRSFYSPHTFRGFESYTRQPHRLGPRAFTPDRRGANPTSSSFISVLTQLAAQVKAAPAIDARKQVGYGGHTLNVRADQRSGAHVLPATFR